MTRFSLLPLLLASTLIPACGQDDDSAADAPPPAVIEDAGAETDRDALVQAMFEAQSAPDLTTAIRLAREGGVSEQAILEARFLFLIDQEAYPAIAALAPEFLDRRGKFQLEDSAIFAVPEDWEAVVEYTQSLAALEKNDRNAFKKHIMEAFWLSPRQASAFAPHIERLRLMEAMENTRIDLNQPLFTQDGHRPTSLAALAGDSRHLLLHFWSPWSQECEAYLADFLLTAKLLEANHIKVVSVLAELAPDVMPDAEAFRAAAAEKSPGAWILENDAAPLGRTLRVQNLPTAVLIDRTGSILFNGHPAEDSLWSELQKISPAIVRPELAPAEPAIAPDPVK